MSLLQSYWAGVDASRSAGTKRSDFAQRKRIIADAQRTMDDQTFRR